MGMYAYRNTVQGLRDLCGSSHTHFSLIFFFNELELVVNLSQSRNIGHLNENREETKLPRIFIFDIYYQIF